MRCLLASLLGLVLIVVPVSGVRQAEDTGDATATSRPSFEEFLAGIRTEALARGISAATLDRTLDGLTQRPVVIARDRAQPERIESLEDYVDARLTRHTVANARASLARHRAVLARVTAAYGIPARLMVAIWGLESNFGRFTGTHPTLQALATLAYDNRRTLFRRELFDALLMVDRGLVSPEDMKGSWAGAMGQPQFMPSSFLKHAVDFDHDGHTNIWTSTADVFGSMGNYLRDAGWVQGERWGREVLVSSSALAAINRTIPMRTGGCQATRAMTQAVPLPDWAALGVTLTGRHRLPRSTMLASLVRGEKRYFLVYRNYEALIDYNCSHSYAIAVGLLSDRI